ncbi:MAG TPA: hypothetical protein VKU60_20120 [Chloroflexota bacterium]|nr:hypothetical protein [Chloroflexota bacterium]
MVDAGRLATNARIVQVTRFDPATRLIESLAWSGFQEGLPQAAIRMARKLFPDFDPYRVKPRVDINRCNEQVYLHGQTVLAPFDEVALGAVDHRILAVAIAIGKIRRSYLHPLRVDGELFGALGFHAQEIDDDQRRLMDVFVGIAQELLALALARTSARA